MVLGRRPDPERRPALDGVRALAVLAVVAFHGELGWAPGGFLGVDVFFVLSGFLITRSLLARREATGTVALGDFWVRRVRRIVPALVVLLAGLALFGGLGWLPAGAVERLPGDALAALASVANWRFIATDHGYFGVTEAPSLLEHTWSLSIEEQFYLVWPLVILAAAALVAGRAIEPRPGRRPNRLIAVVAAAGVVASAAWMGFRAGDPEARGLVYWDTLARLQGPLAGAALGALLAAGAVERLRRRLPRWAPAILVAAGLATLAALVHGMGGGATALYPGGFLLAAAATALVIIGIELGPDAVPSRLLGLVPLAALGRISYGVYLWHWPLLFVVTSSRTGLDGAALHALRFALTVAAATASFLLVEEPVRTVDGRPRRIVASLAAAAAVAVLGVAAIPAPSGPAAGDELASAAPAEPGRREAAPDPSGTVRDSPDVVEPPPVSVPGTSRPPATEPPTTLPRRRPGPPLRLAVFGDSVAGSLAAALAPVGPDYNVVVIDSTTSGCGVMRIGPYVLGGTQYDVFDRCAAWRETWDRHMTEDRPDVAVFALGRHEVLNRVQHGNWTAVGDPAFDAYVREELTEAVAIARRHDVPVVFLTAPYFASSPDPSGRMRPENAPARVDRFNDLLDAVAAQSNGAATVVDLGGQVSPGGAYAGTIDEVRVRSDGVHFAPESGALLAPWLLPRLAGAAP